MNRFPWVVAALIGCSVAGGAPPKQERTKATTPRPASKGVNLYSRSRELAMGQELSRDVMLRVRLIEDPTVTEYVNRLAQNLANQSEPRYTYLVRIIRSNEPNAFALPGGFVFIHSGLIRAANNEAELAAALAHEIGHVAARHYSRQASMQELLGYASIPLLFIGGWPGMLIQEGAAIAQPLALRKMSRGAECEADNLGVRYLYEAGYDPTAFVDFLERVAGAGEHGLFARLISVHPQPGSRIRAIQREIGREFEARPQYLLQTSEFDRIQERIRSIESGNYVPWEPTHSPAPAGDRPLLRRVTTARP